MMKLNKFFLIIEVILISLYLGMIILSIVILPLNIILGVICVLFLPGYNLLNLMKPKFNLIQKVGYMTIISLGLENIIMFFSYIFLYDIVTTPDNPAFFFNNVLLITSIQFINLTLIIINQIKKIKIKKINPTSQDYSLNIKNYFNMEKSIKLNFIIFIGFCVSLIFLVIYAFRYEYPTYRYYYSYDFTFFYKLPFMFYIFLVITIISLTYIIVYSKSPNLILISISMFLYCLWILPYLQFGDYFNDDSLALYYFVRDYQIYGIRAYNNSCFLIYNATTKTITDFGYSTSFFTGIILMYATDANINITLWYLFPIIFITIPFFFYSTFKKLNETKNNDQLNLVFIMILAICVPQFLKNAHSATTGVIGTYIFFLIVIEFYNLIQNRGLNFKNFDFVLVFFLYFFLCLTRTEECIYFIIIFSCYSIYYIFFRIAKIENEKSQIKSQKKSIAFVGFFLLIFSIIFYGIKEFFQYFKYFYVIFRGDYKNNIFYNLYESTMFKPLNILNHTFEISYFVIMLLIIVSLLFYISCYLISIKYYSFFFKIFKILLNYSKKVTIFITNKIISKKFIQTIILSISIMLIFFINLFISSVLIEQGFLILIEIIGGYTIFILNLFFFIKGTIYYKFNNDKQNFFLLSIISSSFLIIIAFIMGNIQTGLYLLHVRFASYFIFFNLIIVQDNYFKDFMRKKKIYLILLMVSLLFLGTFYSLRKLKYG